MPEYKRFVTYLFQYENAKKGKNCGFAKVEVRQNQCRIELQVKGYQEKKLPVYLFVSEHEKPKGIYIGELNIKSGMGNGVFLFTAEHIYETPYGINDIKGLYLTVEKDSFIASQWDDTEIHWNSFSPYKQIKEEPGEEKTVEEKENSEVSVSIPVLEPAAENMKEQEILSDETEKEQDNGEIESLNVGKSAQEAEPELHATQAVSAAADVPYRLAGAWEQQWQLFTAAHPAFWPFDEDEGVYGVKLELRDFKILPKQYWYLANNSFLLHGYFNYHYILFGYMDGEKKRWFLGVPGVFQNQEQLLAGIFGFPEFRTKQLTRQKTGEFGYWYRYLEMNE